MSQTRIRISQGSPADYAALWEINQASIPGVSSEAWDDFQLILSLGTGFVAYDDTGPVGFINLIAPGCLAYKSQNLRWLENWQNESDECSMIYVDRIAIAPSARKTGLGETLYRHAFEFYANTQFITAEVNTQPDNPGSHRFHERLGFRSIGEHVFEPDKKAVRYYAKALKTAF